MQLRCVFVYEHLNIVEAQLESYCLIIIVLHDYNYETKIQICIQPCVTRCITGY